MATNPPRAAQFTESRQKIMSMYSSITKEGGDTANEPPIDDAYYLDE